MVGGRVSAFAVAEIVHVCIALSVAVVLIVIVTLDLDVHAAITVAVGVLDLDETTALARGWSFRSSSATLTGSCRGRVRTGAFGDSEVSRSIRLGKLADLDEAFGDRARSGNVAISAC